MAAVRVEFQQTISRTLVVAEETQDTTEGYMFSLGNEMQFVAKDQADAIARFILFGEEPEEPIVNEEPIAEEPTAPAPEEPVQ